MSKEQTLSIIKPDATSRNITGQVNSIIEKSGLKIIGQKRIKLTKETAGKFYEVHKDRPFFQDLVSFMVSGPVIVQVLQCENAISMYRKVMGETNPKEAAEGTIRKEIDLKAIRSEHDIGGYHKGHYIFQPTDKSNISLL